MKPIDGEVALLVAPMICLGPEHWPVTTYKAEDGGPTHPWGVDCCPAGHSCAAAVTNPKVKSASDSVTATTVSFCRFIRFFMMVSFLSILISDLEWPYWAN